MISSTLQGCRSLPYELEVIGYWVKGKLATMHILDIPIRPMVYSTGKLKDSALNSILALHSVLINVLFTLSDLSCIISILCGINIFCCLGCIVVIIMKHKRCFINSFVICKLYSITFL